MADDASGRDKVVAGKVPFAELCGLLEKLSKTQGNDKKKRVLRDFVDLWRRLHSEVHADDADITVRVPSPTHPMPATISVLPASRNLHKHPTPGVLLLTEIDRNRPKSAEIDRNRPKSTEIGFII